MNLRQTVFDEIKKKKLSYASVEEELGFQRDDIKNFIYSEWIKLSKEFSTFKLCQFLNIPIENVHVGYFIDFSDKEYYWEYMNNLHKEHKHNLKIHLEITGNYSDENNAELEEVIKESNSLIKEKLNEHMDDVNIKFIK